MKRLLVAAVATSASLALGSLAIVAIAQPAPSVSSHATGPRIVIRNFAFTGTFRVHPGQRVTVINRDFVTHTLTSNTSGKFNTRRIPPNGGRRTFTAPRRLGRYGFHCSIHRFMRGTLRVVRR